MSSDAAFYVCATVLFILFYGEPDLMTALTHFLMK